MPDGSQGLGWVFALYGVAIVVWLVLLLGIYALFAWVLGRIFQKAGIEAWKAWVPIYNYWVLLELGRQPGWIAVLILVPLANVVAAVFMAIAAYKISIGFGKDGMWVLVYIFVPFIWLLIFAFDSSRWQPWRIPTPEAPFGYAPPPGATPGGLSR